MRFVAPPDHLHGDRRGVSQRPEDHAVAAVLDGGAFRGPGVLEAAYEAPFGTAPGTALVHLRIVENLVHGWDLARATGQARGFPDDVAGQALARSRQRLTSRPEGPGAPFAAEVPVPPDALAIDRLAGFLGRPVEQP
jgi:uncharacterized protein (TIGR03086 family)